jgi:hypothetical protein
LTGLKARYLKLLSDLPEADKGRIAAAGTQKQLETAMTLILTQGTKVRFKVRTVFEQKEDLDSDDKDHHEQTKKVESIDVWNEPGDCGIAFQKGETYLVYAIDDEESNRLGTNVCLRSARLSDAGEDLAYLYFFQGGPGESIRLEGFVTSEVEQLNQDRFQYSGKIGSPVANVVVELQSENIAHYTEPDVNGRFVFDGLTEGEYQVSVFEAGFPDRAERLSGPKRIHLKTGECAITTLLVLSRGLGH